MAVDSISKYFSSDIRIFKRSQIKPADYNPRYIDAEGKKYLKKSLKLHGVLGGIVVNARTGFTIVGGHQKVLILDETYGYPENDYELRAEVIDVDEATEKTINITLNNPKVGGVWDYDKMREIIPDIDYKAAGLDDADLSMIGVDFFTQTENENIIVGELTDLMAEANEAHAQELAGRKEVRIAERLMTQPSSFSTTDNDDDYENKTSNDPEYDESYESKKQHMKEVKQQVKDDAIDDAYKMDAYLVLSFSTWAAKADFCNRYSLDPYNKFTKGELFDKMIKRVDR